MIVSGSLCVYQLEAVWQAFSVVLTAMQRKSHLCIISKGIARTQSQFPHLCVCEPFIYSQDRSTYFPAAE
jgi:hypothetical protein